jgi:multisubunit Na+/H+ antiporter MnhF subunit
VNGWLWAAAALAAALVPLLGVAALSGPLHGLVAAEVAGVDAALAMLLLAEGTESQSFASLALVLGVLSLIGSIAFIRFLALVEPDGNGEPR